MICALLLVSGSWAAAQAYLLAPGDSIRVFIPGLPGADHVARIDLDGRIRLPYIGVVPAAGQTLDDLQAVIARQIGGKLAVFYLSDGTRQEILLGDLDAFVTLDAYRDLTVAGTVREPGAIPFRPGMTVRAAIAAAGGLGAVLKDDVDAATALRLVGELEAQAVTEAELLVELWRLDSLLTGTAMPLPEPVAAVVASRLGPDFAARMAERIRLAIDIDARGDENIGARLTLMDRRIEFLERTVAGYQDALEIQSDQLANVQALFDRGLSSNDRVSNIRNDAIASSTRLLSTEAQLAEAQNLRSELQNQAAGGPDVRREQRIRERAQAEAALAETRTRLNSLRNQLAFAGLGSTDGALMAPAPSVTIIRGSGPDATRLRPALDDLVLPGDVLDVALEDRDVVQ
jgi:polysaccharide export outer membrane protein